MSRIYMVYRNFNNESDSPIGYSDSYKVAKLVIKSRTKAKKKRIKQLLSSVQFADDTNLVLARNLLNTKYHIRSVKNFD